MVRTLRSFAQASARQGERVATDTVPKKDTAWKPQKRKGKTQPHINKFQLGVYIFSMAYRGSCTRKRA